MKNVNERIVTTISTLSVILGLLVLELFADPIDLNQFEAIPSEAAGAITISNDGSSATITESSEFISVILSNDPGAGDPQVIAAGEGVLVQFDYAFTEGEGEDDLFEAFITDSSGSAAGEGTEFSADETNSGTVIFDVSDLVDEQSIGLQFQLSSRFGSDSGTTSTVTISNPQINLTNVTTTLNPGWNLFSIPVTSRPNSQVDVVFGNQSQANMIRSTTIWEWASNQFTVAKRIVPGNGYWVYIDGDTPVTIKNLGTLSSGDPRTTKKGWNLVGIKDIVSIQLPTNTEIRGNVFGWNSANKSLFSVSDSSLPAELQQMLLPSRAYWMYLSDQIELMLSNPL